MRETMRLGMVLLVAIALALGVGSGAGAQGATPATGGVVDLQAAVEWIVSQQNDDGVFPGLGGESGPGLTVDAIIALGAAQQQGLDTQAAIDAAVGYLESGDVALVFAQTGQGQAAKLVLAAVAAGTDPRDIAGVDALALVEQPPTAESGLYGTGVYDHALVMLALVVTGGEVPAEAVAALESSRTPDGGWAFDGTTTEGAADSNTTAIVVQALVAAGEQDSGLVADALSYLQTAIAGEDGATYQPGNDFPPDAASTASVMQAVIAAGEDPAADTWGNLPAALASYQKPSGAFFHSSEDPADNLFSTVLATPAAAGMPLPIVAAGDAAVLRSPVTVRLAA